MNIPQRAIRVTGPLMFAVIVALVAALSLPESAYAQGRRVAKGQKHDQIFWKHDFMPPGPPWWKHDATPPGPPCLQSERPCPPGQSIRNDNGPPGFAGRGGRGFSTATRFGRLAQAVSEGTLPLPYAMAPAAQNALARVWLEESDPATAELTQALTSRGNEAALDEAVRLVTALEQLPSGDEWLPETVRAFNAFLDASDPSYLRSPAPEFLVVHAFLEELVLQTEGGPRR